MSLTWMEHPEHGRVALDDTSIVDANKKRGWKVIKEPTLEDIYKAKGLKFPKKEKAEKPE